MPSAISKTRDEIIQQLEDQISNETGNMHEDDLDQITSQFTGILNDALKEFNSEIFDKDGFIKKLRDIDLGEKNKGIINNILDDIRSNYLNPDMMNQSELLIRRDIHTICTQMPEMADVIKVTRDGIVEANVSTGEVARTLVFENHDEDESLISQVKEIENHHDLLYAEKNFIVPHTLENGEFYIHAVPYAKLFAELEMIHDRKTGSRRDKTEPSVFKESIPYEVKQSFSETKSLFNDKNVEALMESVSSTTNSDAEDDWKTIYHEKSSGSTDFKDFAKKNISSLLDHIEVSNGSSILMTEMGEEGFKDFLLMEYTDDRKKAKKNFSKYNSAKAPEQHFMEAMSLNKVSSNNLFNTIDQDDVNTSSYDNIKGCYIKYLDPLRMIPIRVDRRIIGYYYVTTTMDLNTTTANPNGVIDLSYQHYTRDKNMVDQLSNLIIQSFDKRMLDRNIKLKNEIAEIIMAHKFAEGKLSFIYIPEDEIIRFSVNEDENGRGHSMIEPTIFPARNYLMLNMYNMLFTLNNNLTRIHYVKSSGLNKDYASQIQRTMRKFQSRRINVDDVYSYQGVLNKVGGMGEMVLPAGRNDYKALETDTIDTVNNPISIEFLEQQRRQALSGTGAPHLLIINAIDEVDFAKTLEMANTRFNSTVASYKIDFNKGITKYYKFLLRCETDIEPEIIETFRFQFNPAKQQELNITADMIQNFNALVDVSMSMFFKKEDMEDDKGNPTEAQRSLRRELAKEFLPIDIDHLEEIVKKVNVDAVDAQLQDKVSEVSIEDEDIEQITGK